MRVVLLHLVRVIKRLDTISPESYFLQMEDLANQLSVTPEDVKLSAKQDMRSLQMLIIEDNAGIAENIGD